MNCNVHVFRKMILSIKFGFILETSLFLSWIWQFESSTTKDNTKKLHDHSFTEVFLLLSKGEEKMGLPGPRLKNFLQPSFTIF
jgi:hypothetical protein